MWIRAFKRRVQLLQWWWLNRSRSFFLRRAELRCQLRSGLTPSFRDWADWAVFRDIFVEGDYDVAIRETLAAASSNGSITVLDIGANVGLFTLRLCHLRRLNRPDVKVRVHQFEACGATFQRLLAHSAEQPFDRELEDIRPHFGAVGRRRGTIRIAANPFHAMAAARPEELAGNEVPFVDLDQLIGDTPAIHLLKCDIEGGEKWLLEEYESLLQRTERAVFEFHLFCGNHAECLARLEKCGLRRQQVIMANEHITLEYFTRG